MLTEIGKAEYEVKARRQGADAWLSGSDEQWKRAADFTTQTQGRKFPVPSADDRLRNAATELRIMAKLQRRVELLREVLLVLEGKEPHHGAGTSPPEKP
jgi:hypothetical protein